MIQYYTTIEQVKKLISLGLDPGTADMYYIRNWGEYYARTNNEKYIGDRLYPCWSVGALMDLIPKHIVKNNTEYSMCLQTMTHCYSLCHTDGRYLTTLGCQIICKSLMDAVYQYVVWLIENGYINGNEPNN